MRRVEEAHRALWRRARLQLGESRAVDALVPAHRDRRERVEQCDERNVRAHEAAQVAAVLEVCIHDDACVRGELVEQRHEGRDGRARERRRGAPAAHLLDALLQCVGDDAEDARLLRRAQQRRGVPALEQRAHCADDHVEHDFLVGVVRGERDVEDGVAGIEVHELGAVVRRVARMHRMHEARKRRQRRARVCARSEPRDCVEWRCVRGIYVPAPQCVAHRRTPAERVREELRGDAHDWDEERVVHALEAHEVGEERRDGVPVAEERELIRLVRVHRVAQHAEERADGLGRGRAEALVRDMLVKVDPSVGDVRELCADLFHIEVCACLVRGSERRGGMRRGLCDSTGRVRGAQPCAERTRECGGRHVLSAGASALITTTMGQQLGREHGARAGRPPPARASLDVRRIMERPRTSRESRRGAVSPDTQVAGGYVVPQGVYSKAAGGDDAGVRALIVERRLAPFYVPGDDEDTYAHAPENSECPICFMYYPTALNYSRCCRQPICTECFVQIRRAPPNVGAEPPSRPATCPFCVTENFGVVFEPRAGGEHHETAEAVLARTEEAFGTGGSAGRSKAMVAADDPRVVLTDHVHPEWEEQLAEAQAAHARRATRRVIMRQVGDTVVPIGVSSSRTGQSLADAVGQNAALGRRVQGGNIVLTGDAAGTGARGGGADAFLRRLSLGRRRTVLDEPRMRRSLDMHAREVEDLMVAEAVRRSIVEHEEELRRRAAAAPPPPPASRNPFRTSP